MKKINYSNYTLLQPTDQGAADEFIKSVADYFLQNAEANFVVDLLEFTEINHQNIKELISVKQSINAEKYSFVVLINQLKVEDLPEEINTVPTLKEAEDVIQMEAIERDLGF